jgi:hypothetical protein
VIFAVSLSFFFSLATYLGVVLYIHLASSIRVDIYPSASSDSSLSLCEIVVKMTKEGTKTGDKDMNGQLPQILNDAA